MQNFLIICSRQDSQFFNLKTPDELSKCFSYSNVDSNIYLYTSDYSVTEQRDHYYFNNGPLSLKISITDIVAKTDLVASRSIWYFYDRDIMVISSRQSFINQVLGSFELNEQAWVWLIATGCIGPQNAWDKRIKSLKSAEKLSFSISNWKLTLNKEDWSFPSYSPLGTSGTVGDLDNLMEEVALESVADSTSLITLSGGYDSRAVLWLASRYAKEKVHTGTWGIKQSFENPLTDAGVARKIAEYWNVNHHEFNVELLDDFEKIIQKFLIAGDGRNDHINMFMDGLAMWETIQHQGFKTVYRGDEAFGWLPVVTPLDVVSSVGLTCLTDFKNIPRKVSDSLPIQNIPEYLKQLPQELVEDWRDRLYQEFRMPYIIAPLQDLILQYVDVRNPLLSEKLIRFVRTLPPQQRTSKLLYSAWVKNLFPEISFSTIPSVPESYSIIQSPSILKLLLEEINSLESKNMFGPELINYINDRIKVGNSDTKVRLNSSTRAKLRALLPVSFKKLIRNKITGYQLPVYSLLLRMYLALKAKQLYSNEIIKRRAKE